MLERKLNKLCYCVRKGANWSLKSAMIAAWWVMSEAIRLWRITKLENKMSTQQILEQISINSQRLAALAAQTAETVEAARLAELALRDASTGNYAQPSTMVAALIAALVDIEAIANGTVVGWTAAQRADERYCRGAVIGAARRALREAGK